MNQDVTEAIRRLQEDRRHQVRRFDPGTDFEPRVAVLPSSFNPPTFAHLRLLELAREQVDDIAASAALLSTSNVDKGVYGADLPDRVGMLLAIHEVRRDIAILASNAARIMDQAGTLRGEHPGVGFDFVVGFDTLVRVFDERYYEGSIARELDPFFHNHRLIATNRAEWTVDEVQEFLDRPIVRDFAERILVRELEPERARHSSTEERETIEQGGEPIGIPPAVADYIRRRNLYGANDDST